MIDASDPAYHEIRAELVRTTGAVRAAAADLRQARRRRNEAIARARAAGFSHSDIGYVVGVTKQGVHYWEQQESS